MVDSCATFHSTSLLSGIASVKAATLEQLQNETLVIDMIQRTGLHNPNGPQCNPAWARGSTYYGPALSRYAISVPVPRDPHSGCAKKDVPTVVPPDEGCARAQTCWYPIGLWQMPPQLSCAMMHLSKLQIRSAATIGTFTGWTDAFLYSYLRRLAELRDRTTRRRTSFSAATIDVYKFASPCVQAIFEQEGIGYVMNDRDDPTQERTGSKLRAQFHRLAVRAAVDAGPKSEPGAVPSGKGSKPQLDLCESAGLDPMTCGVRRCCLPASPLHSFANPDVAGSSPTSPQALWMPITHMQESHATPQASGPIAVRSSSTIRCRALECARPGQSSSSVRRDHETLPTNAMLYHPTCRGGAWALEYTSRSQVLEHAWAGRMGAETAAFMSEPQREVERSRGIPSRVRVVRTTRIRVASQTTAQKMCVPRGLGA